MILQSETNEQQVGGITRPAADTFIAPSHKRTGSIPPRLILEDMQAEQQQQQQQAAAHPSLDIYSQIKTSTKSILPGGLSPKFELLQNEVSPVDDDKQS